MNPKPEWSGWTKMADYYIGYWTYSDIKIPCIVEENEPTEVFEDCKANGLQVILDIIERSIIAEQTYHCRRENEP